MTGRLRLPRAADYTTLAGWIADAAACARWAGPQLAYPFAASELPALLAGPLTRSYALLSTDEVQADRVTCSSTDTRQAECSDTDTGEIGTLLAFGQLVEKAADTVRFARIIVHPGQRHRGLGYALCQRLLDEARAWGGFRRVTLGVYRDNDTAIALYRRLGFREDEVAARAEIMTMALDLDRH